MLKLGNLLRKNKGAITRISLSNHFEADQLKEFLRRAVLENYSTFQRPRVTKKVLGNLIAFRSRFEAFNCTNLKYSLKFRMQYVLLD